MNLFRSYCLPIITYACEALFPSKPELKSLDKLISNAFSKNFHTFDSVVIGTLTLYFGLLSCEELLRSRQFNFLNRYYMKDFVYFPKQSLQPMGTPYLKIRVINSVVTNQNFIFNIVRYLFDVVD